MIIKNKKGFTLIELLAVIAILSILVVLSVPNVLELFSGSKKKTFITQAQSIFKAAEQEIITRQLKNPTLTIKRFYSENTVDRLELSKSNKLKYCIKIESGKIKSIAIADGEYWYINNNISQITEIDSTDDTKFGTGNKTISCNYLGESQLDVEQNPLYKVLEELATTGTYAGTYSGTSNDTYGEEGTKSIYYIKTSTKDDTAQAETLLNKINVRFAGFCWQMLRTTNTGGVKLIYNGEPDNSGHCIAHNDTSTTHKGIIGIDGTNANMAGNYMYSDAFTYNTSTGEFTLVNPVAKNWSNSGDKEYILGKYTCKNNTTSTCSTLYYINNPHRTSPNNVWYTSYTIGDTQHAQIGTSPFNANYTSPAYFGYKYGNNDYGYVARTAPSSTDVIMGRDVEYVNGQYILKDGNNNSTHKYNGSLESNYHYTCNTTSATCTGGKVRYYYNSKTSNSYYYYTEFTNGDKVEDAVSKMIDNTINKNDSAIKTYLENWYYNNLRGFENYIDQDAVYCNDRTYTSLGGWSKIGEIQDSGTIIFTHNQNLANLNCNDDKDRFSVRNSNAKINYPIGLATKSELYLINNNTIRKTGQAYWTQSPNYFAATACYMNSIRDDNGGLTNNGIHKTLGVRPVITLAPNFGATMTGNGSLDSPYVIGE